MLSGPQQTRLRGYAGSVAFSGDGTQVAFSAPRGGAIEVFDVEMASHDRSVGIADVCGLAPASEGFMATSGAGTIFGIEATAVRHTEPALSFDNHLIRLI